jgi:hypothetical protein
MIINLIIWIIQEPPTNSTLKSRRGKWKEAAHSWEEAFVVV